MNVVFGIGIAVILFILVMLATQVFYKAPVYEDFCNNTAYYDQPASIYDSTICADTMTVKDCNALIKEKQTTLTEQQKYYDECSREFQDADEIYGKNLFIINNIAGILLVIVSLFLFSMVNIAAGASFAGLVLIIYGFMRGWQGTGDILKFVVALIVAVLFITFAVMVNKRYNKSNKKK
jgi:ABC-type transport system involved in cytochrome bd biosynthesis fused ATPase/permease subunit